MGALLGMMVSVTYGAADFCGGVASKRVPTRVVILIGQVVGLFVVLGAAFVDGGSPTGGELALGLAGGAVGIGGLTLLYRGLATSTMGVVAPLAAIGSAAVPVIWSIASGGVVSLAAWIGIALALVATALVSRGETLDEPAGGVSASPGGILSGGVLYGAGAGLGFGLFYVIFGTLDPSAGFWPLAVERIAATTVMVIVVAALGPVRAPARPASGLLRLIVLAGILDATANVLYVLGTRAGDLATVSVLSSLYPATTVVLAWLLLDEHMGAPQLAGITLAVVGVGLMTAG